MANLQKDPVRNKKIELFGPGGPVVPRGTGASFVRYSSNGSGQAVFVVPAV
jgi:hypothetical protein